MVEVDKLLYSAGINIGDLRADVKQAEALFHEMNEEAKKVFGRQIGTEIGRAFDPKKVQTPLSEIRRQLSAFGEDTVKQFDRTFGRMQAKKMFDPFRDESQTFFGQLKQSFRGGFDIKSLALGTAAGFGLVELASGIKNVGAEIIKIGADAAETRSKFDVVFGDLSDSTRTWANNFSDSVGRARIDTEGFLASFQGLIEPMGFTNNQAAEFSRTLVSLATDVASFNNQLDADVIRDFQSALTGESEPVKKYGIIINEARIKQEALNMGIIKAGEALTEQQKVQVRYNILLADTTAAQGDAIRTADSLANQQKRLESNWKNLADSIGEKVVPALANMLAGFNDLFAGLGRTELEDTIASLRKLGVAGTELTFLEMRSATQNAQVEIDKLNTKLNMMLSNMSGGSGITSSGAAFWETRAFREGLTDIENTFGEIISSTEGVNAAKARMIELDKQFAEVEMRVGEMQAGKLKLSLEEQQALNAQREYLLGQRKGLEAILGIGAQIVAQKEIIKKSEEAITGEGQKQAQQEVVAVATKKELTEEEKRQQTNALEALKRRQEEQSKLYAQIQKQVELESETTELGRKLAQIRMEAEERRKVMAGYAEGIRLVNEVERNETQRTIDAYLTQQRALLHKLKFDGNLAVLDSSIAVKLKKVDFELDDNSESFKVLRDHIAERLGEVAKSFDDFLQDLRGIGVNVDRDLLNISSAIYHGINDFVPALNKFKDALASTKATSFDKLAAGVNAFSLGASAALPVLKSLFGGLFGNSERERQRAAERARLQKEYEEAATARAKEFADQMERVVNAVRGESLEKLQMEYEKTLKEIADLSGETNRERLAALEKERDQIISQISYLERQGNLSDSQRLALEALREAFKQVTDEINALGDSSRGLTDEEKKQLDILIKARDDIKKQIEDFGAAGDSFSDMMAGLRREFEWLDMEDKTEQFKRFREEVKNKFGVDLPESADGISEFMKRAVAAIKAGGQTLKDFLGEKGLAGIKQKDLFDILEALDGFGDDLGKTSDDIKDVTGEIVDKFSELMSRLELEFDLFDVDDPVNQMKRMREEILRQFNAIIPTTEDGLNAFIKAGFEALGKGEEAVKKLLADFNLEELTADTLETLLRRISGLARSARKEIDKAVSGSEERVLGTVRQVTMAQANELVAEASTSRVVLTQMLDIQRGTSPSVFRESYNTMRNYLAESNATERQQLAELVQIKIAIRALLNTSGARGPSELVVLNNTVNARTSTSNLSTRQLADYRAAVSRARGRGIV